LIPAALLAIACWWWRWRRDAAPLASILLFSIGVAPVLGLVPFDFQVYSTVADHYVYLAMLGPAVFVGWVLTRWPQRGTWAAGSIVLLSLAVISFRQAWTWRDSLSIARQAVRVNPRSFTWHDRSAMNLFYVRHDADAALASERRA